jgi:GxxExxY protein
MTEKPTPRTRMPFEGKHSELTGKILGAFYQLHKEMGYGFSEKIYQAALAILLEELGLTVEQQKPIRVFFHGKVVGDYVADMIVNGIVMLELKAVENLNNAHEAQLLNYLKATEVEVGLLLNFGPKAEFRREIYDNPRKGSLSWIKIP